MNHVMINNQYIIIIITIILIGFDKGCRLAGQPDGQAGNCDIKARTKLGKSELLFTKSS